MLLGELHHGRIDLDLHQPPHRLVLEHLLGDAAVAAPDDQHVARLAVGQDRQVAHHLVIDELVARGDLRRTVEHQHLAEELVLEQHQVLMRGLRLVEHALGRVAHAKAFRVKQRLGNPASFRHGRLLQIQTAGSEAASRFGRPCPAVSRIVGAGYSPWPRSSSLTATRFALNASRSTGTQASGLALPHMNTSSAA